MPGNCAWTASANSFASAKSGFDGLEPEQVGVGCVGQRARDGGRNAAAHAVEALVGPVAGQERRVVGVDVAGQQRALLASVRAISTVSTPQTSARQARGDELGDELARRHQDLAAQVPALLDGRELVLEVHAGGARVDHVLHHLERVQRSAEAGLRVGDERREPVDSVLPLHVMVLVGLRAASC